MDETGRDLTEDPDAAADMAANAVINYMHKCGMEGEKQKREWIALVFERVTRKGLVH